MKKVIKMLVVLIGLTTNAQSLPNLEEAVSLAPEIKLLVNEDGIKFFVEDGELNHTYKRCTNEYYVRKVIDGNTYFFTFNKSFQLNRISVGCTTNGEYQVSAWVYVGEGDYNINNWTKYI